MRSHPISVALAIGFLATLSCGETSQDSSSSGGKAGSGGKTGGGTGGASGGAGGASGGAGGASGGAGGSGASSGGSAATTTGGSGGTIAPGPVICSGTPCAANQDCCLLDGKCFDPTTADETACAKPTSAGPNGETPCAASSQCAAGEYCQPTTGLCLGPGYCLSKTNCGSSSPSAFCGCDGVTYPDVQTACHAGVILIGMVECGKTEMIGVAGGSAGKKVTYCATTAMCPAGEECCSITGNCYAPAQPGACAFPPDGTKFPCVDNAQCFEGFEYCAGEGCDSPGGCKSFPGGSCSGVLDPVCGCDGKSYVNASCAAAEGVRVDHAGACP